MNVPSVVGMGATLLINASSNNDYTPAVSFFLVAPVTILATGVAAAASTSFTYPKELEE